VQSSLIAARIRRLADEKGVPVHAFVEDVAASGGYWLASRRMRSGSMTAPSWGPSA
jgi:ClpP class serine protease